MSVKGQYELVLLLSHIDPGLLRLAVTEANDGHTPAGVEGVGIAAFCEACRQCVKLGTARPGQTWPFAEKWMLRLRSLDRASMEADETERVLKRLEEWRASIARHTDEGKLAAATVVTLRDAELATVAASRDRLAAMLDALPLAATPDFQTWEILALLVGRALRGELRDGYSHVPLTAELTRDLLSQYLSANAARDAVWREAWKRQAALLQLPPEWSGEADAAEFEAARLVADGPNRSGALDRPSRYADRQNGERADMGGGVSEPPAPNQPNPDDVAAPVAAGTPLGVKKAARRAPRPKAAAPGCGVGGRGTGT
jgi:hypothetical protein